MADSPNSSPPSPSSSGSSGNSPPPPPPSSSSSDSPSPPSGNDDDNNNNNNNNNNGGGGNTSPSPPPPDSSSSQPPPSSEGGGRNSQTPPGTGGSRDVPVPVGPGRGANSGNVPRGSSPSLNGNKNADGGGGEGSSSSSSSSSSSLSSSARVTVIVGLVGFCVALILMVIICIICSRRKKKRAPPMPPYAWQNSPKPPRQGNQNWQSSPYDHAVKISPSPMSGGGWGGQGKGESGPHSCTPMESSLEPSPSFQLGFNKSTFTYEELAAATKGFDQSNMLGQGGFGYVHKGVLPNGKQIAVKSLKSGSGQGDREFHAEVEIISRVHHRHLVSLVGYCIAAGQRMLVYEFVPNNTLEHHLHKKGNTPLDFSIRLRIALGSAKGLAYLHEDCHPRIIHRDIKASNILLDDNFEAMVADFGLAKLTTDTNTHVSTRVMGTFGYLAPEYASSGKLTEKSDVFSFGVMLLELITGRRPVDPDMKYMEDSLVDWSRPLLTKALEMGNYDELADPRLERNYIPNEMQRMVACAAASIRHSSKKRPKMSQIVRALEGDVSLEDLNDGTKAGQSSMYGSPDTDYDSRQYSADLKKFRQMAFATQDFASSEYGGTTSEYGLNPSMSSSDSSREVTSRQIR